MTPKELRAAAVRAEQLRARAVKQGETLRAAASQMADHATTFAEGVRAQAEAGDPDALRNYRRALRGRARARRLAAE